MSRHTLSTTNYKSVPLCLISGGDYWRRVHGVVWNSGTQSSTCSGVGGHGSDAVPRGHGVQGDKLKPRLFYRATGGSVQNSFGFTLLFIDAVVWVAGRASGL